MIRYSNINHVILHKNSGTVVMWQDKRVPRVQMGNK